MSNFFKKIREAIASFSGSSNKEMEISDSSSTPEYKPVPRRNVKSVTVADIPAPKKKDKEVQQSFRKRENAVTCDVPVQLIPQSVSKKRVTETKRRNNKRTKASEKKQ